MSKPALVSLGTLVLIILSIIPIQWAKAADVVDYANPCPCSESEVPCKSEAHEGAEKGTYLCVVPGTYHVDDPQQASPN